MNALPNPPISSTPIQAPRTGSRHQARRRVQTALILETSVKLGINLSLSIAAVAAMVRILPYHLSQQGKLQDIRLEVQATEERVARLRTDFSRYFDPQQVRSVMQEQTHRVDPQQRQVVWLDGQNPNQPQGQTQPQPANP